MPNGGEMKKYILGVLIFVLSSAHAYPEDQALANLAEDYADCATYFTILIVAAQKYSEHDSSGRWAKTAEDYKGTLTNSIAMLRVTMVGQPDKYLTSKLDLHMAKNQTILANEGIDRLMLLYADQCKSLMENPKPRTEYWLNKK